MTHELKFCELCGFTDDGTVKANALSVYGRCPFCEQAYQRGREDAARDVQALIGYSYIGCAPLIGLDTAVAAARGETQ